MYDPVAGRHGSDLRRLPELHLVLQRRQPEGLVRLRLGHDDHAPVPVENAEGLLVRHPCGNFLGQQGLDPAVEAKARLLILNAIFRVNAGAGSIEGVFGVRLWYPVAYSKCIRVGYICFRLISIFSHVEQITL